MVKTTLVEKDIEEGGRLLDALDKSKFRVKAALWFYLSDSDIWRIKIASRYFDDEGPLKAYSRVQSVLAQLHPQIGITLNDISIISPKDDLIRNLRTAIKTTGSGIAGIRFTRNTVNNMFIEDAYIYRMQ